MSLFAPGRRSEVQAVLWRWADEDPAIVAAAVVGSEARDAVDRWSDIDLTFAVADVAARDGTLARWTARMERETSYPKSTCPGVSGRSAWRAARAWLSDRANDERSGIATGSGSVGMDVSPSDTCLDRGGLPGVADFRPGTHDGDVAGRGTWAGLARGAGPRGNAWVNCRPSPV